MRFEPLSLENIKIYSVKERKSKVTHKDFAKTFLPPSSFRDFLATLPNILAAKDFKEVTSKIAQAYQNRKVVLFALGAHVIKVGLNPLIISLMEKEIITALALNGAGIIHDVEIAAGGQTSEEVSEGLDSGTFGMAAEPGLIINGAICEGVREGWGIGRSIGEKLLSLALPFNHLSLLATGAKLGIPITVHIALGTDTIHIHPSFDPALAGKGSHLDFRLFSSIISYLEGGVYLNLGSAVLLPEVFLKALTLVRNLGFKVENFTTVNMDFIKHYRPLANVVCRPTQKGGKGYNLIGHHEIMIPLLVASILAEVEWKER